MVTGSPAPERGVGRLLGTVAVGGLLAGIALDLLTWFVARYGPQASGGEPWSFRGNGALIVPLGLGPALVAGVWTALVLHDRSVARWQALSIGAGLVGVGFVLAGVLVFVAFGPAAQRLSDWLSMGAIGWMLLAPLLAVAVPLADRHDGRLPARHLAAGVAFTLALVLGFFAAELVLPPGS